MARTSKKDQAKQDLAARLGVPVGHILNIDQVIEMIEPSPTKNAMSKNPKGYPPFFIKGHGHSGLYPLAWVDEYLATGKVKGESGYVEGGQPWPPAPPPPPPVDPVKRDNALAFLDKLGVKVDPKMKNPAQIKEVEDYRKGVSEGF
ncbi:hypothetical protein HF680_12625 [Brevundimonas sp. WCHBH090558]|uniref:hypothetical protein n=1 Tax=Brevundimonas huaxiensis TaxID=2725493 RepID=UPI0016275700|nr:hypothetical protein [Brevundimonas huaxiensis]MBC1183497.1 hypothetical protein [Brevundimonas huaxiensis]